MKELIRRYHFAQAGPSHRTNKVVLFGVAPTGPAHVGYIPYFFFLKDLAQKGYKPMLIIADSHARFIDVPEKEIKNFSREYAEIFSAILKDKSQVHKSSEFIFSREYVESLYCLSKHVTPATLEKATKHYGLKEQQVFSTYFCTLTQILDSYYFNAGYTLCGKDEAEIYQLFIPAYNKLKYAFTGLYHPLITGLDGKNKMGASVPENSLLITEGRNSLRKKIETSMNRVQLLTDLKNLILRPVLGREIPAEKVEAALYTLLQGLK